MVDRPGPRLEPVAGGYMLPVTDSALIPRFNVDAAEARRVAA
ncbi:hypothetical protein [Massilia timonae]|uniref:Uncharacterized protein n=1 Tax=Massilia timonae TaxID=47229 RepID=A0A1S2N3H4_9BURK|nr:hypothetical protein [Massilia timonae]OIJ39635.1 hypothetical protein LO55_3894 [Massilia timonae]